VHVSSLTTEAVSGVDYFIALAYPEDKSKDIFTFSLKILKPLRHTVIYKSLPAVPKSN
jgi:hypothetical protein